MVCFAPRRTAPIAADKRAAIELPDRVPRAEPHVAIDAERQSSPDSLARLATLQGGRVRVVLRPLPGGNANVADLFSAAGDLPSPCDPLP
jgi:hypothetical protein